MHDDDRKGSGGDSSVRDESAATRTLTRRAFLRGSTAAGLWLAACDAGDGVTVGGDELALAAIAHPDDVPPAPLATFPLGVASGDVTADAAILWTRHAGTAALALAVWEDTATGPQPVGLYPAARADGGFVHVDLAGLAAGARYHFAFVETSNGQPTQRSAVGRFRAALAADAIEPVTFGAVACTSNGRAMATLERAGERGDLDLFCLLGDTTYNDGSRTRSDFRGRWAQNLGTAGYRGVRAATSLLATWDDHEITNDWNPETINRTTLANGTAAFFEHLPIRRQASAPDRVYRSVRWGLTAEFFVLDSRSERRPSTRFSSSAQYLSRAQMDWLKAGLLDSPCVFRVILNSVPITNFPGLFDILAPDRWEGYPAARTEILSFVADQRIDGVLWVAGDFHLGSAGRLARSGLGADQIEVLVGPGAQVANILVGTLRNDPQFDFVTGTSNYTAIHLDPETRTVRATFHDGSGTTIGDRSYAL
jgi:phosphodiesterase/alkaline phosphatase D-like protein